MNTKDLPDNQHHINSICDALNITDKRTAKQIRAVVKAAVKRAVKTKAKKEEKANTRSNATAKHKRGSTKAAKENVTNGA